MPGDGGAEFLLPMGQKQVLPADLPLQRSRCQDLAPLAPRAVPDRAVPSGHIAVEGILLVTGIAVWLCIGTLQQHGELSKEQANLFFANFTKQLISLNLLTIHVGNFLELFGRKNRFKLHYMCQEKAKVMSILQKMSYDQFFAIGPVLPIEEMKTLWTQ